MEASWIREEEEALSCRNVETGEGCEINGQKSLSAVILGFWSVV